MIKEVIVLFSACLLADPAGAQQHSKSGDVQTYRSPDNAAVALITSTKAAQATHESWVELRSRSGKLLARTNYSSEDGEHGYGVTKAAWTPDSQFFVFSLESSGGHQAWHSPVQFFSCKSNKILSLDDKLNDAVTNPQFKVESPDKVTVELWFSKTELTVSLSSLGAALKQQ